MIPRKGREVPRFRLLSLTEISPLSIIPKDHQLVALKCFFDGANQADSRLYDVACLAAVSGTASQWRAFDRDWKSVLNDHGADFLHMTDVLTLNDRFTKKKGWTHKKAKDFLVDCVTVAEKHTIRPRLKDGIIPYVATVVLADFKKARIDNPKVPRDVNELLATQATTHVIRQGVKFDFNWFEFTFDQNEPFMGHITQRARNKKSRRHLKPIFDRLLSISEADMRRVMALQLADLYAWCLSHKAAKHREKWHNRILNQRKWIDDHYGYDAIVKVNEQMVELTQSWSLPPTRATR